MVGSSHGTEHSDYPSEGTPRQSRICHQRRQRSRRRIYQIALGVSGSTPQRRSPVRVFPRWCSPSAPSRRGPTPLRQATPRSRREKSRIPGIAGHAAGFVPHRCCRGDSRRRSAWTAAAGRCIAVVPRADRESRQRRRLPYLVHVSSGFDPLSAPGEPTVRPDVARGSSVFLADV